MLINKLPPRSLVQDEISVWYLKINGQILAIVDHFAYSCYKVPWARKMLKYMATGDQICWFTRIFFSVIVDNEAYISGNVINAFGFIARTEADAEVLPAVA